LPIISSRFSTFQNSGKKVGDIRMILPTSSITIICSSEEVNKAVKSELRLREKSNSLTVSSNTSWKMNECTSPVTLPSSLVISINFLGGYNLKYTFFSFVYFGGFFSFALHLVNLQ